MALLSILSPVFFVLFGLSIRFAASLPQYPQQPQQPLVIDYFNDISFNALSFYHGPYAMSASYESGGVNVSAGNAANAFNTRLTDSCFDLTDYTDSFLHLRFAGSSKFTISLQENTAECKQLELPFPQTWDSVEATQYTNPTQETINGMPVYEAFVPITHFDINLTHGFGFAIEKFYSMESTFLERIEIVPMPPHGNVIPPKIPTGKVITRCNVENAFAFTISKGQPELTQRVLSIIKEEDIPVTFFVRGDNLEDFDNGNWTNVYKEAIALGHQLALHGETGKIMETMSSDQDIDNEFLHSIQHLRDVLGRNTSYFRPEDGILGARTRQAAARNIENPFIILGSFDVKDAIFGALNNSLLQFEDFKTNLEAGGDIVIFNYMNNGSVGQLRSMIQEVKQTGRTFLRVDQCVEGLSELPNEDTSETNEEVDIKVNDGAIEEDQKEENEMQENKNSPAEVQQGAGHVILASSATVIMMTAFLVGGIRLAL